MFQTPESSPLPTARWQEPATPVRPVTWPTLAQMRQATHARPTNLGRQAKLAWGLLSTQPYREQFDALLLRLPHWQPVFARQAKSFEPLVQSFMDRRFNVAQRFKHLQHDLTTATSAFGLNTCQRIARGERVTLWDLPSAGTADLSLNNVSKREGMWALGLWTHEGVRLCQISFSFICHQRLMIGSVQGAPVDQEQAMQGIRDLTRSAEGLRPPHLLVEVLRALCRRWHVELVGIDPQHHVKKNWFDRELKVSFDYRTFWLELGALQQASGMWAVPTQRESRDLSEIPSKRRAMYRRRAALLQAMPGQLINIV